MWPRHEGKRAFSFGTPGEMRTRLTNLALDGVKVATAGLLEQDYVDEGEAVEKVGEIQYLLGDGGRPVARVEITRVEVLAFSEVPWEFADAEGEGFRSVEHWRNGHVSYYAVEGIAVTDDTEMVCVWFRVLGSEEGSAR